MFKNYPRGYLQYSGKGIWETHVLYGPAERVEANQLKQEAPTHIGWTENLATAHRSMTARIKMDRAEAWRNQ